MQKSLEIGNVVFSTAGRDEGKFFVICEIIDDTFVKIVDGDLRRIDKPKVKKIKHLNIQPEVLEKLAEKFKENKKVFDAEIKSALRVYNG